jgi:RNA polymerase sigma factor (sigma-70 family)
MATGQTSRVIERLRSAVLRCDGADRTDAELLEGFVRQRDEAAFAALVHRHGPMVWGVCRRLLPGHQDAEDAFQASFLVLVRRAASVRPRAMVGNWLYGVARRTARKARALAARRRGRERQVADMPEPVAADPSPGRDRQRLLDQELEQLPEKYRVAILMCDLGGRTRQEAARQLGVPEGTLSGWLSRGRAMLAKRLARHGLAVSGGALAVVLSQQVAAAAPAAVVASTIRAANLWAAGSAAGVSAKAAALAEGVLKAMLLTRLKIATAVLLAVLLAGVGAGAGGGGGAGAAMLRDPAPARPAGQARPAGPPHAAVAQGNGIGKAVKAEAIKTDMDKLQGTWVGVGGSFKGKESTEEECRRAGHKLVIAADQFGWATRLQEEPVMKGAIEIDPARKPRAMDLTFERDGKVVTGKCIYELDGDTLKLCYGEPDRPTEFKTTPDSDMPRYYIWKREKK